MEDNRRSGNAFSWVGWLVFFLLIFGSSFLPPLAHWLSQQTGVSITPSMLIAAIIGGGVLISIASSVIQAVNQGRDSNETRLPTELPPDFQAPSLPTSSTPLPSSTLSEAKLKQRALGEQKLPPPPQFEPIISPRILAFGIVGLIVFGGLFGILFLVASAI
ncbi:hypothetical protein [Candidatus Viridilinea mediisalina]|uniref:Uncharacterized protein n=1 Tax=Candidatus Viridilinea mediisalina TaxID=2024553 RepID=A0A2A6RKJ7_9CHLR|nr:hypothetical protein [Candidatus Viridilinea mediisalina]PDW03634.1 hypothetical protein CJ255_07765 [Candidatus Viridilinea mediisalina]